MDPVQPSSLETTYNNRDSTRPSDSSVSKEQEIKELKFCLEEEFEAFDPEEFAGRGMNEAYSVLPGVYPPRGNLQTSSPVTKRKISLMNPVEEFYPQKSQKRSVCKVSTAAYISLTGNRGWMDMMAAEYDKQEIHSIKEEEGLDDWIDMMAAEYDKQEIHSIKEEEGLDEWIDMMAAEYDKQMNNSVRKTH